MPRGGARVGAGRKPKADSKVRKDFTAEELKELVMSEYVGVHKKLFRWERRGQEGRNADKRRAFRKVRVN